MAKDLFSEQSKLYSRYRPSYPQDLFNYVFSFVHQKEIAWDCATGNGQAATHLAERFKKVMATDISSAQIQNAAQKENIEYVVCPAEKTTFEENTFDLITVAQAYHWLNWPAFHNEVYRVAKNNAVIAIWNYNLLQTDNEELSNLINHFYLNITGPYWEPEREFVDNNYATAQFNFDPLPSQQFSTNLQWTKEDLIGYLNTWSAVRKYIRVHQVSPIGLIQENLDQLVKDQTVFNVCFPLYLKIGRVIK